MNRLSEYKFGDLCSCAPYGRHALRCYDRKMQADLHSLKRRPFLVPLLMPLALLGLVVAAAIWLLDARTSTVMILVLHAEQAQGAAANPGLSAEGLQRSVRLQQFLARARPERGVDAVYVAEGAAAQQTAAPLAQSMGLAVNVVASADWDRLPGFIMRNHASEVALIVGTRAGLLSMLKNSTAVDFTIDEHDYGSVFVIARSRLSKAAAVRLQY